MEDTEQTENNSTSEKPMECSDVDEEYTKIGKIKNSIFFRNESI